MKRVLSLLLMITMAAQLLTVSVLAQETDLHNGMLRVGYGGELGNAKKICEIKNDGEIGKSADTVKVGDATDVTVRANRAADKTVTDIATAYTIIKDEETPVGSAQNLTDEAGTYTITPKLADEEIRYEVVDALTQSAKLVVEEELGKIALGEWRMDLDSVVYLNYYPVLEGFSDGFDFATRGGVVLWTGDSAPTSRYDIEDGKPNTVTVHGMRQNSKGEWYVRTSEIYAKNLGDRKYIRPYITGVNGEMIYLNGAPYYSAAEYCYDILKNPNDDREKDRYVCGALLEYGASAQVYFNWDTDNLVTKIPSKAAYADINLADYTDLYPDLSSEAAVKAYLEPYGASEHAKAISGTLTGNRIKSANGKDAIVSNGQTLDLQGAIRLSVGYDIDTTLINEAEIEEAKVMFWTESQLAAMSDLKYENIDERNTYIVNLNKYVAGENTVYLGEYVAQSDHILAKNLGEMVYFTCRIEMKDGTVYRSGLGYYSPEGFVYDHLKKHDGIAEEIVCERIAVYGEMARIRFKVN